MNELTLDEARRIDREAALAEMDQYNNAASPLPQPHASAAEADAEGWHSRLVSPSLQPSPDETVPEVRESPAERSIRNAPNWTGGAAT